MSRIVLINGTSSSGKTTIGKLLQAELKDPAWILMSVDSFLAMMPDHADKNVNQWIRPFLSASFQSVAAFVRAGFPAIVDTVFEHRDFVEDYKAATDGIKTIYVGLFCPLEILEERERARGDRRVGMARVQCELVHKHVSYDLRLDTDRKDPKACVQEIIVRLRGDATTIAS